MSKADTYESDVLAILFTATALANVWDNAASSPITNLYIGLHSSNPAEADDQTTNELSYTGYSRVAVARSGSGWTVASGAVDNDAAITFGACTGGGPQTAAYFTVGRDSSGTGKIFYTGQITTPSGGLIINTGITPEFAAGDLDVTED